MAGVSTYLNFAGTTEAAFAFYKEVFGTEFEGPMMRHGDVPLPEGAPPLAEDVKGQVINVVLPILGGHLLQGSDIPEGMGMTLTAGNTVQICLHPDTRGEADRLFAALSAGGEVGQTMQEMFWGDYYGDFTDRFGVRWLVNCESKV